MCQYIYERYEQCSHQRLSHTKSCWQDSWDTWCPCVPFPKFLFTDGQKHLQDEDFFVKPGMCRTCEKREKEGRRRDYGGFTAQATHGVGSSQGAQQAQWPAQSSRSHRQPQGYRTHSHMNMAPQEVAVRFDQTRSYNHPRAAYNQYQHSRQTGHRSGQPPQQSRRPHRPMQRRDAVRGRQVGNKVIMDQLPRDPPQGFLGGNQPFEQYAPGRDLIDRSFTVSPLTDDERNAPYVEIPLHDEYPDK
ncbi:hypothetical protein FHETE_3990 [Fusarium heterosporum]|uniref:Uncharacterized protein n=1 Tax=Fusarium heterosporum TaxID=42747 RepID=A0A8H5WQL4_FUSHE|nr:hypothetical protein FHETE_3990 [Fusarium heterosporum]